MSMMPSSTTPTTRTAAHEANRLRWATCLARYTAKRRQELGLTVAQAAELSGLQLSEWYGLEQGWIPDHLGTLRAIAGTLQVRWQDYDRMAFFAMLGQTCC